jgi:hypothetical protein
MLWILFQFGFLILFCVIAICIAMAVLRESAIFREFNQSRALGAVVLLYPFGPLVVLIGTWKLGTALAFALAAACYVPGFMIARSIGNALERAGTDRVKEARDIATQALGMAIAGFIYVATVFLLTFAAAFI